MAFVSISEAIRLSGVSRPTFYRKHLGDKAEPENRVSVQVVGGHKKIETSELLRVFNVLHETKSETLLNETHVHPKKSGQEIISHNEPALTAEVASLKQQLQEYKQRENWYQQQISTAEVRAEKAEVKLLEHLTSDQSIKKWFQFWK